MIDIVLINAPFSMKTSRTEYNIPQGLLYIGSVLTNAGYKVKLMDWFQFKNIEDLEKSVLEHGVDAKFVGFSVMTSQVPSSLYLSKKLKSLNPDVRIVWGGVHPTLLPEQVIDNNYVDVVVVGEGEYTCLELLKKPLEDVKGIYYKKDGKVKKTGPRPYLDVNELPFPDWELLGGDKFLKERGMYQIITSRGCPSRCTFCINVITKNIRWRALRTDKIVELIRYGYDLGISDVRFREENFMVSKKRVLQLMEELDKENIEINWKTTCRCNYIRDGFYDIPTLKYLSKHGCKVLLFGAESGSQKMLDLLKKDITPEDIIRTAKYLTKAGIDGSFSFMIGLPKETYDDISRSIKVMKKIKEINPKTGLMIHAFRPYPGGDLYDVCIEHGLKPPKTLEKWAESLEVTHEEYIGLSAPPEMVVHDFPWVKDPDLIMSLPHYLAYGFMDDVGFKRSKISLQRLLFRFTSKIRVQTEFFGFPIEYKIARIIKRMGANK